MLKINISDYKWRTSYHFAMRLSVTFWIFSMVMMAVEVKSNQLHALGPIFYFFGSCAVFLGMVRSGGALAPIAWYVGGTGLFFGLGITLWALIPDVGILSAYSAGPEDLARVNLLNSTSIFVVLLFASLVLPRKLSLSRAGSSPRFSWQIIYKLTLPFTAASVALSYYYFPFAEDLTIRSMLAKLGMFVPMFLLLTGMLWKNISSQYKAISLAIIFAILVRGVLSFSKTEMVYPLLCLLAGYWVSNQTYRSMIVPVLAVFVLLIVFLIPMVTGGRADTSYDASGNTLSSRSDIVGTNGGGQSDSQNNSLIQASMRVSHGPVQRFLIDEYLAGRSGDSLVDFWTALVPRILWSGKPNISRFGIELHQLFFNSRRESSHLAPTYSAEAYWNYGSIGVLSISALLGLQLGWLTKCWFYAIQGYRQSYLVIAFPAAFYAVNVEAWIASTYFGGFITLLVTWLVVELLMSVIIKRSRPRI